MRLVDLFHATESFEKGDFTLSSGKKSSFYIDCKKITLVPEALDIICREIESIIAKQSNNRTIYDAVGGMTLGADAIVGGLVRGSFLRGSNLSGFIVRKEPKGHGTKKYIEGPLKPGQHTILVEDVSTTGLSLLETVNRVRDYGCSIAFAVTVVDREEGAKELLAKHYLPLFSILTLKDLNN